MEEEEFKHETEVEEQEEDGPEAVNVISPCEVCCSCCGGSLRDERHLTAAAKKAVEEVELALTYKFVTRIDVLVNVQLFILRDDEIPCGW